MELTKENLKQILAETSSLGDEVLSFDNDKSVTEQGVDSLDTLDYLLRIEEEYGVSIPDDEVDSVNTIDSLYEYLKARL